MSKKIVAFLFLPLLALVILFAPQVVHADAINYQALKYGTNSESMASGYYVKPANVVANGDQYLVTMTIHTGTSLGKWPVTVLSINGTGPANVTKTQSASGYDYSYAFATRDLTQTINSSISIDVPDVYVAKHNISFKFDTSHLPALASAATATSATNAINSTSSSQAIPSNKTSTASSSTSSAKAASSASTSSKAAASSRVKKAATTKADTATKKQAKLIESLNRKNKQTQQAIVIGGVAGVLILGVAAYFFVKRK
ncbi:NEAT domain-containing protein [Lacticaseibacillus sp. GG6-2]